MTEYLTPDDVAEITGMSVYTVRAAVRAGQLKATKPRARILIHRDAVAEWLEEYAVRPDGQLVDFTPEPVRPRAPKPPDFRKAARAMRERKDAA